MSTPRAAVTRYDQIEPGACYRIKGSVDGSRSIPPQVVRVESKVTFRSVLDIGHCRVSFFTNLGVQGKHASQGLLFMDQVNIPEHGQHDRHLERIPDELVEAAHQLAQENMQQEYTEMATDDEAYRSHILAP